MSKRRVILFGFGNVGGGFYRIFQSLTDRIPAEITAIVVKHKSKHPSMPILHAYDEGTWREAWEAADIVIECTSDPSAGWQIIYSSLQAGKAVITASKRPLAENLDVLDNWLREHPDAIFRHEAAALASLPIFGGVFQHFAMEPAQELFGVVNGTTHYILQRILREGLSYAEVLLQAQQLGYAEEDPFLDVSGWDAAYKLILLSWRLFGVQVPTQKLPVWGITGLRTAEQEICHRHHLYLKPIVQALLTDEALHVYVGPAFVPAEHVFTGLEGAENGLLVRYAWAGRQFYQGLGAGPLATGSAILGDLQAILSGSPPLIWRLRRDVPVRGIVGTFYLRGASLIAQLPDARPLSSDSALWHGDASTLYDITRSYAPDSYFVAQILPEVVSLFAIQATETPSVQPH